jgi:hypothetical protein
MHLTLPTGSMSFTIIHVVAKDGAPRNFE